MNKQVFSMDFYGKNLSVEVGELAKQANGAVLVRYNDTVILSTVVAGKEPKNVDFFPLTVTYEEKLYSVGKIPGGFLKREGRPSEHGTLTARMIDRPIRPLFADGFRNEVQSVNTVLSVDQDATPEMAAMLGASLALCVSDIPFNGPIAGVNVGLVDGEFIVNGTPEQLENSLINLEVAGTKNAINMVEADAKEVSEEVMLEALLFGHEKIKELIAFQEKVVEACGKEKIEIPLFELNNDLVEEVAKEEAEKPAEIKVAEKEYVYKKPEDDGFKVERTGEHSFIVTGNKLERLVQRTNLDHTDGIMLLARKLKRMGVDDALREKGAVNGDDVSIADFTFEFVD